MEYATIARRRQTNKPETEALIATAIADLVKNSRDRGQSLSDLISEIMVDDQVLDMHTRKRLSTIVSKAWETLPSQAPHQGKERLN